MRTDLDPDWTRQVCWGPLKKLSLVLHKKADVTGSTVCNACLYKLSEGYQVWTAQNVCADYACLSLKVDGEEEGQAAGKRKGGREGGERGPSDAMP